MSKTARPSGSRPRLSVRIRANLLYYSCKLIGYLPFWFLYHVLAQVIFFLLYYVVRYRVKVTRQNLRNSFPEKSEEQIKEISRKFYSHLAEVFVDTIDLTSISAKELQKRMVFLDMDEIREATRGKNFIAATAHYGSWEYFMAYAIAPGPGLEIAGVYRPLHNEAFDIFYQRMRSRFGMVTIPMSRLLKYVIKHDHTRSVDVAIGMVADQVPPFFEIDYWFDFFHQPTPFFHGMERIAVKFGMPIYFIHITKLSKAHYQARLELLYDGEEPVEKHEITQRYVTRLEEMIRERPELWMWSHRRWKRTPEGVAAEKARRGIK